MVEDKASTTRVTKAAPLATPWILGVYGLAGATFVIATRWAGWYGGGGAESRFLLVPLAAVLGGITLLAGRWAFEASDGLATAILGTWGAFWIAYGLLNALFVSGNLPQPVGLFPEIGFWFIVVSAITWVGAVAALSESLALALALGFLAAGSTLAAIMNIADRGGLETVTGWLFVISAVIGWHTATAMMFEGAFHRPVLPLGTYASMGLSTRGERVREQGALLVDTPAPRRAG